MSYVGNTNTTQAFTAAIDYFSGNGSTTVFTLSRPVASVAQVQVTVNNVPQNPSDAFTVLNNTITFTGAPSSGTNNIYVQYTSPITQISQPGQGTVTSSSFGTITNFTTTGNTVLGDSSTDTLNVGNGGLVKDASGNVGIGTSSPAAKLDVSGPASVTSFTGTNKLGVVTRGSTSTNDYSGIDFIGGNLTTPVARIAALTTGGGSLLSFGTSNSYGSGITNTAVNIDQSGNLLVGTTSGSSYRLYVAADSAGSSYPAGFNNTNSGSSSQIVVDILRNSTRTGYITNTNNTTSFTSTSDYRLKEDVQPMQNALQKVAALKPVTYKWKSDGTDGQGFIAHELAEHFPDAVAGEKDAVNKDGSINAQGIDTSFLVATLTAAIQEQQALITTLTERITALEAK